MITRQGALERESSSKVEGEGFSREASRVGRLGGGGLHLLHQVAMDVLNNTPGFTMHLFIKNNNGAAAALAGWSYPEQ